MKTSTQSCMRLATLVLALSTLTPAQLAGSYSIDSSQPTSGTNYASFIEAAAALVAQGVSGPVVFVAVPGTGPYAGWNIAAPIVGASAVNSITFAASGPVVISGPGAGTSPCIQLGAAISGGPSYLTFDGLELQNATTSGGFIASGCTYITIRNCKVHNCGSGIWFATTTNSVAEDNEVYAVGNTALAPASTTYGGAISLYLNSDFCTVQRNRLHDCTGNGIFLGSSGSATTPDNAIVINNMLWNCPGLGAYPGGIAIRRSGASVISNNSIWMPSGSAFAGIHQQAGGAVNPQPAEISNNVIRHDGPGACFKFESSTVIPATLFDYNVYDTGVAGVLGQVATVNTTTIAAWQALAAPSLLGREVNTVAGSAGFIAAGDLHISAGSAGFNNGSVVASVAIDIDFQARPMNGVPDRGADETTGAGLFANFSGSTLNGSPGLIVAFTDNSFSSDPGGVLTWTWDFQNDGINDSFTQNPSWTYPCPGIYSVKLTVTDATNPSSTFIRSNYISVTNHVFNMTTTGGGVGDLTIEPIPTSCGMAAGAVSGWTLISLNTSQAVGTGPFGGLVPDANTFAFILTPAGPGNPIHFAVTPGLYPDGGALPLPPGTFSALAGFSMDAVMIYLNAAGGLHYVSNADRVTF